ncbi:HNH endonuclease [Methanoculleus sp. FWC-SCC3]|uniref:HNH endonuclease n=1 Tax=Methanoculleus methanifontis TaxID=2584086 RepID=A0ABT8LZ06_9EURY|nr:HNH endonuclease signature motif containing protein [Methanoculleus sp. FWC-SCC3]MDN7011678.1 HNH endonuclease [Methanoculleus sp. FWC-SCC3]
MTSWQGTPVAVNPDDTPIGDAYLTHEAVRAVLERQDNRCAGCSAVLDAGSTYFDLRLPVICGGPHTLGNLAALCPSCHRNHMRRIRKQFADHRNK